MRDTNPIERSLEGAVDFDQVPPFKRKNIATFCFEHEDQARHALDVIREKYQEDPLSSIKAVCLAEAMDKEEITFPFWVGVFFTGNMEGAVDDWVCSTGLPAKAPKMCIGPARYQEFVHYSRPVITFVFNEF